MLSERHELNKIALLELKKDVEETLLLYAKSAMQGFMQSVEIDGIKKEPLGMTSDSDLFH